MYYFTITTMSVSLQTTNNTILYIPFVGEQYNEDNIRQVFAFNQIEPIRSIIFLQHNYMIGTIELGSVEEDWGCPVIIEMDNNILDRSPYQYYNINDIINHLINSGRYSVDVEGPDGDFWLIQLHQQEQEQEQEQQQQEQP